MPSEVASLTAREALFREFVPVNHGCYPLSNVVIHLIQVTPEERQHLFAQRFASDHPLVVFPAAVVIGPIQLRSRNSD